MFVLQILILDIIQALAKGMAEEDFEVMINDKEYRQLKLHQQQNQGLLKTIQKLTANINKNLNDHKELIKINTQKDLEIQFLVELIQSLSSGDLFPQANNQLPTRSTFYQILGQSILPQQALSQQSKPLFNPELSQKYQFLLNKVQQTVQKISQQEDLIKKLSIEEPKFAKQEQKEQAPKEELKKIVELEARIGDLLSQIHKINNQNTLLKEKATIHKTDQLKQEKLKAAQLQKKISDFLKQNQDIKNQNVLLKNQNALLKNKVTTQRADYDKKFSDLGSSSEKLMDSIQRQLQALRNEYNSTIRRLKDSNSRIRDLQMQISVLKQTYNNSVFAKEETKERIKAMIDEYTREVQQNLKGIEGLSPAQCRQLIDNQLKDLADYVLKAVSKKV